MPNQEPAFAWLFGNGPVRVGTQGLFRLYLKTFVAPFLPARLTAPGSPRMSSVGSTVFPCYKLNGKHSSVGLSPHSLLIPEGRSKRKQIMFFRTWNMLTAAFSLTSCCKMNSLFSTESFFNNWLFISWLDDIVGRPCWLVIKILSLWGNVNRVVLRNPINYKRFTRCSGIVGAFGLHIIALSIWTA